MAHSPLKRILASVMDVARLRNEHGVSTEAALELLQERRKLLKMSALGSMAMLASTPLLSAAARLGGGRNARVVVVGAGLAGLSCAYDLKKAGLSATVYEASERLGGRCSSDTTSFPGQVAENGGELIDTGHVELRKLAKELGLTLDDLAAYDKEKGGKMTFWLSGQRYTYEQQIKDFAAVAAQFDADNRAAPWPQTYNKHTKRGLELDHMSATDYIIRYVPGGLKSKLGQLLQLLMDTSAGIAATEASALLLVGFFSEHGSDERFHIRGGNDKLISGMAARLGGSQIVKGHALTKLVKNGDNTYTLTFSNTGGSVDVVADHVVLALPFAILQSAVDYSGAGFDKMKVATIQNYKMGMHAKFQMQFKRRIWREQGYTGLTDNDTGYQISWEVTRAQPGTEGILTCFSGDKVALAMDDKPVDEKAADALSGLDLLFPGIKPLWNGRVILNYWPGYQWTRGAYSAHPKGHLTTYHGYAGLRQGTCHFAGEHTSVMHVGFLNGAVETGQRCAREIALALRAK